jgi:hypothetical protein
MRTRFTLFIVFAMLLMGVLPNLAQETTYTVLVDGLNNPRGINFDSNGALFIAEAGLGGDVDIEGPFGPAKYGNTARVSVVVDGQLSTLIDYLPSMNMGGEVVGAMDVLPEADTLWVVMGHEMKGVTLAGTVVAYNRVSLRPNMIFDPFGYEHRYDPDGTGELLSNSTSIAIAPDGLSALIVDASGNSLYRASVDGALDVVKAWENNPVPTAVAYNADASQYAVSFLTGFPFANGAARIEVYDSTNDQLIMTYEGLSLLTDVMFDDGGVLLAVSYAEFNAQAGGWQANTGSVVAVTPDGIVPVLTGLNFPYSIAKHPTENWYAVSVNAVSAEGEGAIITFRP